MFNTEVRRSITGSLGRFIAIAGIVALGTGFYAGLRMTAPDMNSAADAYYDATNLMDIRVVSTLGLTDEDISDLRGIQGVEDLDAAYETDVMATVDGEQYAMRVHSMPGKTNQISLAEGSFPKADNECVLCADKVMGTNVPIGGKIYITDCTSNLNETLKNKEFIVTGYAHSPYYVSSVSMGQTSLGSGTLQQFMYVTDDAFVSDYPVTEAFITVEGSKNEFAGSDAYQAKVDEVANRIKEIAPACEARRRDQIIGDAQAELDDARREYEQKRDDTEQELSDAKAKLDSAASEISSNESKLASAQAEYDDGVKDLDQKRIDTAKMFAEKEAEIAAGQAELDDNKEKLNQLIAYYEAMKPYLPEQERAYYEKLIADGKAAIAEGEAKLEAAKAQLEAGKTEAERQFAEADEKLASASAQISSGKAQLESGRQEYESGLAEYKDGRAEADREFAKAEAELADAQAQIDDLKDLKSEWLVMDRTKNPGVVSFKSDAQRVDNIAQVFPFIFFLVAALVALTTMTRMVDEERMLIGTFKALGYSRSRITSKYLIYAAVASGIGALVGIVALSLILPPTIMEAYAIIYYVPHKLIMDIDMPLALLSAGLGIGVTLVATWFACAATLRESPAQLMLPRAPKAGKRILLERIRPIWNRLSFLWKVTFRNLFRYKKRFIMTIIGIAGCTALLLTGLGLQDSINDIIDKQFGQTVLYNVVVASESDAVDTELAQVSEEMRATGNVYKDASAMERTMTATKHDGSGLGADYSMTVIVPEDQDKFIELWKLRERIGGETIQLQDDGVVVAEKLANQLGLKVGDTIVLAEQDEMGNAKNQRYDAKITGIMENYIASYVFMTPEFYEGLLGKKAAFTSVFADMSTDSEIRQDFTQTIRALPQVKTVAFNDELISSYRTMLKSVNMIVIVLVVAAAALAFIVLYNLTNINITERQREIATLKVLGFTQREVYNYIFRETLLLTIIGALAGLVLGVFLEGFVVVTAEVDYVMFGRDIHPLSFLWGFLLTIGFALIVMVFMRKKLDNVNMVESLKSNE